MSFLISFEVIKSIFGYQYTVLVLLLILYVYLRLMEILDLTKNIYYCFVFLYILAMYYILSTYNIKYIKYIIHHHACNS